jgi:WD40 repeat protein
MPTWIRCPHCDVAFPVHEERPDAEVRCDACRNRLGDLGDARIHVDRSLSVEPVATLEGHSRDVWSVAFSPDGKWLASGSIDSTIRLWDVKTGALQSTLPGHVGGVLAVAFSPDGGILASGGKDHAVRLWDVTEQTERAVFRGYTDSSLAFSPDGALLATGSVDDTVRVWDTVSGKEWEPLHVGRNNVRSVAFSPDGRLLALGHFLNSGMTLQVWAWDSRRVHFTGEGQSNVMAAAFCPDGRIVASADLGGQVSLWDAATGEQRAVLTPQGRNQYFLPSAVLTIAFCPNRPLLAMGLHLQGGANVQVWDVVASEARAVLGGHRNSVQSIAFSPDGTILATGSRDRTVRLWRMPRDVDNRG